MSTNASWCINIFENCWKLLEIHISDHFDGGVAWGLWPDNSRIFEKWQNGGQKDLGTVLKKNRKIEFSIKGLDSPIEKKHGIKRLGITKN